MSKKVNKFFKPAIKKAASKPTQKQAAVRYKTGQSGNPSGRPPIKTQHLLARIKAMMGTKGFDMNGKQKLRREIVADAFIREMERGSFPHVKEFIEREEGKVPNRVADAHGENLKLYANLPTDDNDPDAP